MFPLPTHALALQRIDVLRTVYTEAHAFYCGGLSREIARFRIGHCYIGIVFVVGHRTRQLPAIGKHAVRFGTLPSRIAIDGRQRRAPFEHLNHVSDVLRVEVRQVQRRQTRATFEHPTHVGDVLRVEVRQVQRSQARAIGEHIIHVGDVLGVEVRHVKRSQTRAKGEHPTHVGDVLRVEVRQVQRRQA